MKQAAAMSGRDAKVEMGPAVVLFDATRPAELLDMDMLGHLVVTQVKDADMIAISKADIAEEADMVMAEEKVREINPRAEILRTSSFTGLGLDRLKQGILNWKDGA